VSCLELVWRTPAAWAAHAVSRPLELLSDHAHCELGAAAAAQSLMTRLHADPRAVEALARHAGDELRHFRRVHRVLRRRGGTLGPPRANPYADGLLAATGRLPPAPRLLDRLLIAALIERRSLERLELLAAAAPDAELRALFAGLAPSEAGHARLFLELAEATFGAAAVDGRIGPWRVAESELIRALPCAPRVHSGPPLQSGARPAETPGATVG